MIILPVALVYFTMTIIQLRMGIEAAREDTFLDLANAVGHQAKACEMTLMTASKVAHGLADFMIVRQPDSIDEITAFIHRMLATNPNIIGSTVAFEPDAFPNLQRQTQDGTLSPYLVRETETVDGKKVEKYSYKDLALVYKDKKYLEWEWYAEPAKLQKPCWSDPYFDEGGGNVLMCTYSVPFSIDGKFSGVATIDVSLDEIRDIIRGISTNEADYMLFSSAGRVIVAPKHLNWEMKETFDSIADKYYGEMVRTVGKQMKEGKRGVYLTKDKITGRNIFGAYEPLEHIGWSILKRINETDSLRHIYDQLFVTVIMSSIALVIIVAIILFVSKMITNPLKQLMQLVRGLANGNWDIDVAIVKSHDEIEELAKTFGIMVRKLETSIDETVRNTAEKKAAESANLSKSQFLATMSHEMRTPLNGVIGISDLLLGTPLQPKQLEYAQLIKTSGESLLFLINDILDFSKIEAGKFELSPATFNLPKMVDSVMRILAARAEGKHLELVASIDKDIPILVRGDEGRLRQILINLVGNALKFTETGGVQISVALIDVTKSRYHLRFDVVDTGIGISAESQGRLFKMFSQASAATASTHGGTGLGLAICKKLVELMGGNIYVESEAGKGATFGFNITLESESGQTNEDDSVVLAMDKAFEKIQVRPVLIVSSGVFQCPVLVKQFQSWNFTTQTSASASDAFDKLVKAVASDTLFSMVVVDTHLADTKGENLIHSIQQDERFCHLPIILLMPLSEDFSKKIWKYPLNLHFVSKPIQNTSLLRAVVKPFGIQLNSDIKKPLNELSGKDADALKKLRILIAEDNHINQIVISGILKNAGIGFDMTNNGKEVTEKFQQGHYNAVLMDCQMPVMDGYDASQQIRNWERQNGLARVPIIALTANATMEDEAKCRNAGMDAFCSKPIAPRNLMDLLLKICVR
ncbi:MAG: response regulator [Planctomycetaceae bacterium]|jgi:signal transduction histidine kinase/CheY-like chemotaxis protein|nr:response regulator [Planctomycetaceae bacterium]